MISETTCQQWACFCNETCIPYICNLSTPCPSIFNPFDSCDILKCVNQMCLPTRNHTEYCQEQSKDPGIALLTTFLLIGIVIAMALAIVFFLIPNKKRLV